MDALASLCVRAHVCVCACTRAGVCMCVCVCVNNLCQKTSKGRARWRCVHGRIILKLIALSLPYLPEYELNVFVILHLESGGSP
jgi:hypothetical protein